MKKQSLIMVLLAHYEICIAEIKTVRMDDIQNFLTRNYINRGICNCAASLIHYADLYGEKWVKQYTDKKGSWNGYWGKPPRRCRTKKEIIAALNVRVEYLKCELLKQQ